jgi:hypothetical protein
MSALLKHQQVMSRGSAGDPLWDKVLWLLHCDGVDGSTTVTDAKGILTWSTGTHTSIDNSVPLIAGGAFKLPGIDADSTVSYLAVPKSGWSFGSSDFCMEITVRPIAMPASDRIATLFSDGDEVGPDYYGLRWFFSPDGSITAFLSSSGTAISLNLASASGIVSSGTRSRLRLSRSGTSVKHFAEGAEIASGSFRGALYRPTKSNTAYIGRALDRGTTVAVQGILSSRIDEARLTLGAAREHAAYTPSDLPVPSGP